MKSDVVIVQPEHVSGWEDAIRKLDRVCFGSKYVMGDAEIAKSKWWLITVGRMLVAYGGARLMRDGKELYLTRAGVLPAFRGRGFQSALIEARKQYGEARNADAAVTYTSTYNCASVNNLIEAGFRLYQPKRKWEGPGYLYWRVALR